MTTDREFTHADTCLRALVAATCAWEVAAITTGRVPTVSRISKRYPAFGAAVLTGLALHFWPINLSH